MARLKLKASPRLYVTPKIAKDLRRRKKYTHPFLEHTAEQVINDAERLTRVNPVPEDASRSYLQMGRWIQSHLQCLTCAWVMTREKRYREAAIKHLGGLLDFNHISCEANFTVSPSVHMPFCLTYGEQSSAIGLMYDIFRPDMTSEEQKCFFDVVDKFHMREAVKCLTKPMWWVGKSWSNWNGVCSGGMGLMALAMYDDRPEARRLIPFVERSLKPYFKSYIKNGGGCPEGTGYWNYGMDYSMRYVLSWENAVGRAHPALKINELRKSLIFPLDFTGLTFGDNDGWHPAMFYFMLAKRLNHPYAALNAALYLPRGPFKRPKRKRGRDYAARASELLYAVKDIPTLKQLDRFKESSTKKKTPVARLYDGMEWAILADDEVSPTLRMSVRGGGTVVGGHGFVDLLNFRCRVNGELMITDQKDTGYLSTTFGDRGADIYSRSPASKSTLFVDGLSCIEGASCDKTEIVKGNNVTGVRIDATHAIWRHMPVKFIGRLFLFVENRYWLVVDHVLSNSIAKRLGIESRFHTYAKCKVGRDRVSFKSGREWMQMTFAALQPGVIQESIGTPPLPAKELTRIFRWMGRDRAADNFHVAALNPGKDKLDLDLSIETGNTYVIEITEPDGTRRRIPLGSKLTLR